MNRSLAVIVLFAATCALAADGATKKASKIDLGLGAPPSTGEIPKGDLRRPKQKDTLEAPTVTASNAGFSVVKVQHAKGFARSPTGTVPMGALEVLPLSGKPLSTEKFTTVIRVKSPQRAAASIDMQIVDLRGDVLMSSSGNLTFRGTKGDEVDYTVDWDPTPCRAGGDYTLMVRIGGQEMGTWPMKFAEAQAK